MKKALQGLLFPIILCLLLLIGCTPSSTPSSGSEPSTPPSETYPFIEHASLTMISKTGKTNQYISFRLTNAEGEVLDAVNTENSGSMECNSIDGPIGPSPTSCTYYFSNSDSFLIEPREDAYFFFLAAEKFYVIVDSNQFERSFCSHDKVELEGSDMTYELKIQAQEGRDFAMLVLSGSGESRVTVTGQGEGMVLYTKSAPVTVELKPPWQGENISLGTFPAGQALQLTGPIETGLLDSVQLVPYEPAISPVWIVALCLALLLLLAGLCFLLHRRRRQSADSENPA